MQCKKRSPLWKGRSLLVGYGPICIDFGSQANKKSPDINQEILDHENSNAHNIAIFPGRDRFSDLKVCENWY
jgi:trehalose-6-phosphate synthase